MKIDALIIKEKTFELIKEKGYSQVMINDICQACSITKPTFYKYFSSKEELVLDVCNHIISDIMTDSYALLKAKSHIEQLYIIFAQLINQVSVWGYDLYSQIFIFNMNENRHSFDVNPMFVKVCELVISNAQEASQIKNTSSPHQLLQSLAHMFQGYFSNWCIYNGDYDFASGFFKSMNAILLVEECYCEEYKKHIG